MTNNATVSQVNPKKIESKEVATIHDLDVSSSLVSKLEIFKKVLVNNVPESFLYFS